MPSPAVIIDLTTATPPSLSPQPVTVRTAPPLANHLPEEKEENLTLEAVLHKEIATVREGTVRGLLQKICKQYPEAARMVADVLLVEEREVISLSTEESTDEEAEVKREREDKREMEAKEDSSTEKSTKGDYDSNGSDQMPKNQSASLAAKDTPTNGGEENTDKKRYRGKFAVCDNCEEEYDVSSNHKGDCLWHDGFKPDLGDLEVDWRGDFWADHDEDCHGEIDSEYMRREYPEGFEWSCCGMSGNGEGCKTGRHVERIIRDFKRARFG